MAEKHPLAAYRKSTGITQKALAGELGVAEMTVSRWETGERKIGVKNLADVAKLTGIPKRELRPDLAESMEEVQFRSMART
ncbi:MAG: helix-turn-helix protein [Verrucomicrobiota bacterium]|jgi:transcriptional regulator with XRE-family HTH domain|nr:helix-turn-helix protein [Verrucomicrobiota bacterium]